MKQNIKNKRFQECNKIIQIWRFRWYVMIPFNWLWFSYITPFKVVVDEIVDNQPHCVNEYEVIRGWNLWKILKGRAQIKMKWYYTWKEVKERSRKTWKEVKKSRELNT